MFGHKASNKTTVGTATVQNPSMLDNVSTQDFTGDTSDIQQQVQDALTQHEMKKMEIVEPAATGGFMASPTPGVAQANPSADVSPPSVPPPVVAQEPFNVASLDASANPPESTVEADGSIPRPLTPEEDRQAVIDAENTPLPSPVVSAPIEDPAPTAASPTTATGDTASDSVVEAPTEATSTEEATAVSPSAPIDPPAAPPEPPPEPAVAASVPEDDAAENEAPAAETEPTADVAAATDEAEPENESESDAISLDTEASAGEESEDASTQLPEVSASIETSVTDMQDSDVSDPTKEEDAEDAATPTVVTSGIPAVDTSKLAALKQHALDHLEPLADKLDQSPEEEFRTTMMRIQANDNHTLLEKALTAAKKIEDGSARAKALLDIINEINYFAQVADDQESLNIQ